MVSGFKVVTLEEMINELREDARKNIKAKKEESDRILKAKEEAKERLTTRGEKATKGLTYRGVREELSNLPTEDLYGLISLMTKGMPYEKAKEAAYARVRTMYRLGLEKGNH